MDTAPFMSLMSDGSTDSAVIEQEMVYTRFAIDGEVFIKFLSVQSVEKAAAVNIKKAMEDAVDEYLPGWRSKLVAIGSDGAAVMQGRKGGVVTRFKVDCPWLQVWPYSDCYLCNLAKEDGILPNLRIGAII